MHLTNLGAAAEALANIVDLTSIQDSKITKVNLYPSRAEIIRLFVVTVMAGPNRVNISGLPVAVDKDSVRVTGKGSATINDVVISVMPPSSHSAGARSTSLKNLFRKRARTEKAITRCQDSISSLKMYLGTMSTHDIEVHKVSTFTEGYETAVSHLDEKILDLEEQLALVNEEIEQEESKHGLDKEDVLRTHVGIDLEALSDGQIEILLNYAVDDCSWKANYDVRANLDSDDKTLAVTYKASITQNTGEAWDKVPLTLETVNPTFGADIPDLRPWTISVQRYHSFYTMYSGIRSSSIPPAPSRRAAPSVTGAAQSPGEMHGTEAELEPLAHQSTSVTTKGVISAIFEVADLITIPSDKATHNVTVSQISMDASMSWVTVPKARSKAHLKARITNTSEYTFLEGNANIFVNGSFTASSSMPAASPQEIFDLALGMDPSLRITYLQKGCLQRFYLLIQAVGLPHLRAAHHFVQQQISASGHQGHRPNSHFRRQRRDGEAVESRIARLVCAEPLECCKTEFKDGFQGGERGRRRCCSVGRTRQSDGRPRGTGEGWKDQLVVCFSPTSNASSFSQMGSNFV